MRKFILVILLLTTVILLIACNDNRKIDNDVTVIKESEFSEETQIDETVKSISIDIWIYENGQWINSGKTL